MTEIKTLTPNYEVFFWCFSIDIISALAFHTFLLEIQSRIANFFFFQTWILSIPPGNLLLKKRVKTRQNAPCQNNKWGMESLFLNGKHGNKVKVPVSPTNHNVNITPLTSHSQRSKNLVWRLSNVSDLLLRTRQGKARHCKISR